MVCSCLPLLHDLLNCGFLKFLKHIDETYCLSPRAVTENILLFGKLNIVVTSYNSGFRRRKNLCSWFDNFVQLYRYVSMNKNLMAYFFSRLCVTDLCCWFIAELWWTVLILLLDLF